MSGTAIWAAARKDLLRLRRDPWKLALWLGIPLLIGALMTMMMGGSSGPQPRAVLYLEDRDDSLLSGFVAGAFENEQLGELIEVVRMDQDAALERLNRNEGSAALVLPAGFQEAVLREEPLVLKLWTNPAQRILPGILEELLSMLREAVFYGHRLLGPQLQLMLDGPAPGEFTLADPKVAQIAVGINQAIESASDYLDPPLIELETAVAKPEEDPAERTGPQPQQPQVPASFYMLPSVLLMAMFFVAQGLSEDLWLERRGGTMRRALCAPQKISGWLAGKLLGVAGVFLILGTMLFAAGYLYHGYLGWQTLPLAVLWWSMGGVAVYLMLAWVQMICSTQRGGSVISNLLMFPLLMMGGSFFPFEAMPTWMAALGQYTPNGWILQQLKPILLERRSLLGLLPAMGGLLVIGALFLLILRARLRRVVWGR